MNKLRNRTLLLTIAFLFIAAAAAGRDTIIKNDEDQPVRAQLIFAAAPLDTMTEIPFRLELAPDSRGPVIRSGVCDLTMPAMPMPENRPVLDCSGRRCRGRAIFTMAGAWQVRCDLVLGDGSTAAPVFRIDKVRMK